MTQNPGSLEQTEEVKLYAAGKPARILAYRFLDLPHITKLDIALDLGLLHDEDEGVRDAELYKRIFQRAVESDLLSELWDKVEQKHNDGEFPTNPFTPASPAPSPGAENLPSN